VIETQTAQPSIAAAGADELMLRMTVWESIPLPTVIDYDVPEFSLYGDGRVIFVERLTDEWPGLPGLRLAQTTPEQFSNLMSIASAALGDLSSPNYGWQGEVEATSTRFELRTPAGIAVTDVWALERERGLNEEVPPNAAERNRMRALHQMLASFGAGVANGDIEDLGAYEPVAYEATLGMSQYPSEVQAWPWPDLQPEDFGRAPDGTLTAVVTPDQAAAVINRAAVGGFFKAEADDGAEYLFRLKPLLPDQIP
jgi:hypothetical protein